MQKNMHTVMTVNQKKKMTLKKHFMAQNNPNTYPQLVLMIIVDNYVNNAVEKGE